MTRRTSNGVFDVQLCNLGSTAHILDSDGTLAGSFTIDSLQKTVSCEGINHQFKTTTSRIN